MKRAAVLLLLLVLTTLAMQDMYDPELLAYGEEIAARCAENGLTGRVAWVSGRDGDPDVYLMFLDEGYPYRVTPFEGDDLHPALSPDGEQIAWVSEKDGQPDIYLMDIGESGRDRVWRRLTDTPGYENDLSWSADGERIYFSSCEAIDYGTVGLFAGSTGELEHLTGRRYGFTAYYYDLERDAVERLSLFPGDFRYPVHVAGMGVVCQYEPWSAEVSPFPAGLVLIHDALACDPLGYYEGWDFAGPLRRFPNGDLLVPSVSEGWFCYDRIEPNTGELVLGFWYSTGDRLNGTPDPAGGNWLLCQTSDAGDPASEIVLVGSGDDSEPQVLIELTENGSYDGEPCWAVVGE